ncbi:MAG: Xaa-Pro peptidase family protein [Clostridiales bacterium]|nr:Xaa-Pro peptidase family protein [Clostridiales bacterium]
MERLYTYMEKEQIQGMFISRPVNVKYISHFSNSDAFLFLTREEKYLLTDPRYTEEALAECPDYQILNWRQYGSIANALAELVKKHPLKALGYEDTFMSVRQFHELKEAIPQVELVPADGLVEQFRAVKRPEEIECLRISCDIASRAYEKIQKDIRVGVTEKELAARLSYYMVMEGADTQPYGNILISGARTSLLHGIPSAKAIEYGDLVLMDYGCQYHGYLSDMTRTLVVGKATPKQKEVYRLEQQMVADVMDYLKDGASPKEAYHRSTKAIEGTEYFPYHYSGIGHGVGMFVHEIPFMGPASEDKIQAGNVMTVEPGIYIPGWGGIRIENQLLITKDGNENLIGATMDLIEL